MMRFYGATDDEICKSDYQRSRIMQNKENPITSPRKNSRRRNSSKLHRLLVQSPQNCDGVGSKNSAANKRRAVNTPKADIGLPPSNRQVCILNNNIDRYSPTVTINGFPFSPSASSSSCSSFATDVTASGIISSEESFATPTSRRALSDSALAHFWSNLDNGDFDFVEIENDQKEDSDDEGTQPMMSIKSPMISKLFRNGLELSDECDIHHQDWGSKGGGGGGGGKDQSDQDEHPTVKGNASGYIMESYVSEFAFVWSLWIFLLFMIFDWSAKNASDCLELENGVTQATSIFRTVYGENDESEHCSTIIAYQGIVTFIFVLGSVELMGLTLGKWGNAVIKAHQVALASSSKFQAGNRLQRFDCTEHCNEREDDVEAHHYRRCGFIRGGERRRLHRQRPQWRHSTGEIATNDIAVLYGSLLSPPPEHQPRRCHRDLLHTNPPNSGDASEEENSVDPNRKTGNPLVLFPDIQELHIQSAVVTAMSIICIAFVRYYENDSGLLRRTLNSTSEATDNATAASTESSFDTALDERGLVSIFNRSVSTAPTPDGSIGNSPVSVSYEQKFLTLLCMILSVITLSHWVVYIAQRYIQKSQQILNDSCRQPRQHKILAENGDAIRQFPEPKGVFIEHE